MWDNQMRSDEKESQRSGVTGLPVFLKAERREDEIYVSENQVKRNSRCERVCTGCKQMRL